MNHLVFFKNPNFPGREYKEDEAHIALWLIRVATSHLIEETLASVNNRRDDLFVFESAFSHQVLNATCKTHF